MGNITQLYRYQGSAATLIDKLTYTYTNTAGYPTNQLQTLNDASGSSAGAVNGTSTFTGHYDANGNLTADPSKPSGTINIGYNLLNLPQTITGAKTITYTYDAAGQKLRRVSAVTGSTDYISGIEYDAGAVTFIQTEEGRAVPSGSTSYIYDYYLADHLGNTRVTFDSHTTTASQIQKDDYYPFGMDINTIANTPPNNYLYNKKELQGELAEYDYGARFYDPVIGRWMTQDPMAEFARRHSSYEYAFNNPLRFVDPTGMAASDTTYIDPNHSQLKEVTITATPIHKSIWSSVGNFIVDNAPFVGSGKQLYQGIRDGNWKEATFGAAFLTVDIFTAGEGGEGIKLVEEGIEEGIKLAEVGAEDEIKEGGEKALDEISEETAGDTKNTDDESTHQDQNSNGKNEKHGDRNALSKKEKQIKDLEEKISKATGKEKKFLQQKLKNVKETAMKNAKGVEHSRANKR